MENGAFAPIMENGAPFSVIFSKKYFKGVNRRYHGGKG